MLRAPYVVATKELYNKRVAFDASMSHAALAYNENKSSKMYSPEGSEWVHTEKDIKFFAYFFDSKQWLKLGDYQYLQKVNLDQFSILQILSIDSLLERFCGEDVSRVAPHEVEKFNIRSKLTYWALLLSGKLGEKHENLAQKILDTINPEILDRQLLLEACYSAVNDNLLLDVLLEHNFDLNRKCDHLGCFPATWAALEGSVAATKKLLARTPGATSDLAFVENYSGFIGDEEIVEWYMRKLRQLQRRQMLS